MQIHTDITQTCAFCMQNLQLSSIRADTVTYRCNLCGIFHWVRALQRVLLGYIQHPNLAGILLIGLGCEANQIKFLLDAYNLKENPFFKTMTLQDMGGLRNTITEGIHCVEAMLPEINKMKRTIQ